MLEGICLLLALLCAVLLFLLGRAHYRIKCAARESEVRRRYTAEFSHDMRTPLAAVLGYLEVLAHLSMPPEQKSRVQAALVRARTLQDLTGDFFQLSLLEVGAPPARLCKLELNQIVTDAVLSFYDAFTEKGISVQLDTTKTPLFIKGEPHLLERVLQNVLGNCLKYTVGPVSIRLAEERETICVTVRNPVFDLTQIDEKRLFDEFYMVEDQKQNGSSGLGLTIVRRFMEQMGAQVTAVKEEQQLAIRLRFPSMPKESDGG